MSKQKKIPPTQMMVLKQLYESPNRSIDAHETGGMLFEGAIGHLVLKGLAKITKDDGVVMTADGLAAFLWPNQINKKHTRERSDMIEEPAQFLFAKQAVDVLNRALSEDPEAMRRLMSEAYVPCNRALADDPTIQVHTEKVEVGGALGDFFSVGALGLINGIIGIKNGHGYVAACFNVKCGVHGELMKHKDKKVNDTCGVEGCVEPLILGSLVKFEVLT
jgi:hypothetical protein